jgi:Rad52/22 family double-strand break repair protein
MANIQLYQGDIPNYYSEQQIAELDKPLDPRLVKTRQEGWRSLQYIEGHTAIDQANRIFGYGNWGWHVLECELENVIDPVSGDGIGAIYHARVEVWVRGMQGTIIDVGSQPVSVSSVEEQIVSRRIQDAEKARRPIDESPFTFLEKKNARAVIMQAHEQARKGAGTDGVKRGLRGLGNQFANGLYGDGRVDVSAPPDNTVESGNGQRQPKQLPARAPAPLAKPEQIASIRGLIAEAKPHGKATLEELYALIINKQYPGDEALPVGEWARLYREVAPKEQKAS